MPSRISSDTPSTAWTCPRRALEDALADREVDLEVFHLEQDAEGPSALSPTASAPGASRRRASGPLRSRRWQRARWRPPGSTSPAPRRGSGRTRDRSDRRSGNGRIARERRHLAADHRELARAPLRRRAARRTASASTGAAARARRRRARRGLDDLARVHHRDAVRHLRHDAEVVGDEQQRHAALGLQPRSSSRICAWIVTSSAVVGSSAISTSGSTASAIGDHHALLHAAGKLERILRRSAARRPGCRPRAAASRAPAPPSPRMSVALDHLDDLAADGEHRVEAGGRLLEDHADAPPAHRAHRRLGQREQVGAVELDVPPDAMRPGSGSSRMIESAVIDLPQPDSPTSAKVSPLGARVDHAVDRAHRRLAARSTGRGPRGSRQVAAPFDRAPGRWAYASPRAAATTPLTAGRSRRARRRRTGWRRAPAGT